MKGSEGIVGLGIIGDQEWSVSRVWDPSLYGLEGFSYLGVSRVTI